MCVLPYITEFTTLELRPVVANAMNYGIAISMLYVPVCALPLLPKVINITVWDGFSITGWRILSLILLVPGVVSVVILLFMPESAKFYQSRNMTDKAYGVLEKVCRYNKGKHVTLKSLGYDRIDPPMNLPSENGFNIWTQIKPLFGKTYRCINAKLWTISFLLFATGFGLTVWMPRILNYAIMIEDKMILCDLIETGSGLNHSRNAKVMCLVDKIHLYNLIANGICFLITLISITLLLVFLRRKSVLIVLSIISMFSGFLLNFVKHELLVVGNFVFFTVPPLCSIRLAISVLLDIIPTNLRSKAIALTTVTGRMGILFTNIYVGYMLTVNCLMTFNTYVLLMLFVLALFVKIPSQKNIQQSQLLKS